MRTVTEKYLMGLDKGNFTQNLHHLLPKNIAQESKSRQFEEKKKLVCETPVVQIGKIKFVLFCSVDHRGVRFIKIPILFFIIDNKRHKCVQRRKNCFCDIHSSLTVAGG